MLYREGDQGHVENYVNTAIFPFQVLHGSTVSK